MARYHGRKGRLYLSTSGTGNASPVGSLTSYSLNFATDRVDSTCLGDTNKTSLQGLGAGDGTFEGIFDDTVISSLWSAKESSDGCKFYLYPSTDASSIYFYGPIWLDFSISGSVNGAVTISGTFAANGNLGAKVS